MTLRLGALAPSWKGGRTMDRGYVLIYAPDHPHATKAGYVREHILIVEKARGKLLPKGAEIHHFDENRFNNSNQNLVVCENRAYHMLLHARQKVVILGGDPNKDKFCYLCNCSVNRKHFTRDAGRYDGLSPVCKSCKTKK